MILDIQRKDLPLKSTLTTFEVILNNPKMDKLIIKEINKQGDKMNHKTNVKAQMTEWQMYNKPGFKDLADIAKTIGGQISKLKYNVDISFSLKNIWGMKYKSGEQAIPHDHWPALWSFAYYVNAPEGAPGLFFPEMGDQGGERKLQKGLMVFFQGHIKHSVRPTKFKGYRYVVSGNLYNERASIEQ
tara:strand:- start:444 stop:1001 length:558 start_codon:yes stop_codon:yes gene_type:complete